MMVPVIPLAWSDATNAATFATSSSEHPSWVGLIVLTLSDDRICAMTRFENGVLP
jgi:hypothetical protein